MKYRFIKTHREYFRVSRMCSVLGVSRSGFYDWLRRPESVRARSNRVLLSKIHAVHVASKENYGAVKTWKALVAQGERCGRHRVARLRRVHGIQTRRIGRFRRREGAHQLAPPAPNLLLRRFGVDRPDRVWVADITFIATRRGWLYLAVVIDLFARRVVGWAMDSRMTQGLVIKALSMAIEQRRAPRGLIHHSDQGVQYSSTAYQAQLQQHGFKPSMSRKGNCFDNACAESFFSTLKNELVHHCDFHDRDEARAQVFEYIEMFYNRRRSHQSLGYLSPVTYERLANVA